MIHLPMKGRNAAWLAMTIELNDTMPDIYTEDFQRAFDKAIEAIAPYLRAQSLEGAASKISDPYFKSFGEWLRALASDEFSKEVPE